MRATWRTLTKRPISLSAAADDRLDPLIVSTTNPSLGRMHRGLRVEFSIENHCKIAFSALFQCCIRLQLRRDHHQGSPDRKKLRFSYRCKRLRSDRLRIDTSHYIARALSRSTNGLHVSQVRGQLYLSQTVRKLGNISKNPTHLCTNGCVIP